MRSTIQGDLSGTSQQKGEKKMSHRALLSVFFVACAALAWAGGHVIQQGEPLTLNMKLAQVRPKPSQIQKPPPMKLFGTYERGDVDVYPARLTIQYGNKVLRLSRGRTGTIDVPQNSPLLTSDNKLRVKVKYTLRNKTTKNLKFVVALLYGNQSVASTNVTFFGKKTKSIEHNVKLPATSRPVYIKVAAPGILDLPQDNFPVFFWAQLTVLISAV
jgi:hypothetical protein